MDRWGHLIDRPSIGPPLWVPCPFPAEVWAGQLLVPFRCVPPGIWLGRKLSPGKAYVVFTGARQSLDGFLSEPYLPPSCCSCLSFHLPVPRCRLLHTVGGLFGLPGGSLQLLSGAGWQGSGDRRSTFPACGRGGGRPLRPLGASRQLPCPPLFSPSLLGLLHMLPLAGPDRDALTSPQGATSQLPGGWLLAGQCGPGIGGLLGSGQVHPRASRPAGSLPLQRQLPPPEHLCV